MNVAAVNDLPAADATAALLECCGSSRWAREMCANRPFASAEALLNAADRTWWALHRDDWLAAFRAHPRIGETRAAATVGARAAGWSGEEQAGVSGAEDTANALRELNAEYERRFGHIFIICAAGRSASDILANLRHRMSNDPDSELRVAAEEQRRITHLRLHKLLRP